jgi:hypothetical protein
MFNPANVAVTFEEADGSALLVEETFPIVRVKQ